MAISCLVLTQQRFISRFTVLYFRNVSALEVLRNRALQNRHLLTYLLTYLFTYLLTYCVC